VVWQDQRGNITYDPEKGTIASRWSTVKIDLENMKVAWLDIKYPSLLDLLYMANFINRVKGKHLRENPKLSGKYEFHNTRWPALYAENGWNDVDVLRPDAIKRDYPSLSSKDNQRRLCVLINKFK
jgi:hypothetical protein